MSKYILMLVPLGLGGAKSSIPPALPQSLPALGGPTVAIPKAHSGAPSSREGTIPYLHLQVRDIHRGQRYLGDHL